MKVSLYFIEFFIFGGFMVSYLGKFTDYVTSHYDINDKEIMEKYQHTLRVSTLLIYLAMRLNLSDENILLAFKIGLFHDLGRFREVIRNRERRQKFNNLTFDHGAYSVKILYNDGVVKNFDIDAIDDLLVRKAVYYHNKKDLDSNLSPRELQFCKMIRDVDKLDILFLRSKKRVLILKSEPSETVLKAFFDNQTINIKDLKNDSDRILFYMSFIKDLNFDESVEIAIHRGYLSALLSVIYVDGQHDLYCQILDKVLERIPEKEKKNVREKVLS